MNLPRTILLLLLLVCAASGAELYVVHMVPTNYPSGAKAWLVYLYFTAGENWSLQKTGDLNHVVHGDIDYGTPWFSLASTRETDHVWAVVPNNQKCFFRGRKVG